MDYNKLAELLFPNIDKTTRPSTLPGEKTGLSQGWDLPLPASFIWATCTVPLLMSALPTVVQRQEIPEHSTLESRIQTTSASLRAPLRQ